ncbi:SIR2 family protein [Geobacter sulfurreducens]|uniref:SIR2 family protein n=1 Tax=Geobacter sulfurreducens TaxID=35554 RepID=UPI001BDCE7AD|nr:SIR2 family protein [Geobacter sulfurreducens]QVW35807.1 SIR2 family protein [Geobacter sulfurreducens]
MATEEVIFLGAGASAADGAPIQNALFKDYFKSRAYNDETNTVLSTFFMDFFGIDTNDDLTGINFPTVEEVLGILELALNRNESFRKYPSTPQAPKVQNTRESVIILMARILRDKLQAGRPIHDSLVSRLIHESRISKTAFVSLNYDILIDNALSDVHDKFDLDYGIPFANFSRKNDWHRPRPNRAVKLFKLHGSLNWLYCPTCISLMITPKDKSKVSQYADTPIPCVSCQTNMIPIIIPPTFFKVMSNFFLQQIWREAENTLIAARRIIFCGYSFPDADVHIKYLLKRIELNTGTCPDIYIFNSHHGKGDEVKEQEKQRYERFFSDKTKIYYLDKSFEDFCNNGIP